MESARRLRECVTTEPSADPLELCDIDRVLRATGGSLVGDEIVEADDGNGHPKQLPHHRASAARFERESHGSDAKLDVHGWVADAKNLPRGHQGSCGLFVGSDAESSERIEHPLAVGGRSRQLLAVSRATA
jgi:hypothetical protein